MSSTPRFFWNRPTHSMFDLKNWITSSTKIKFTVYFLYIQNNFKRNITYQKLITMLSNKLNLNTVRENPGNEVAVELLSLPIVWISDIINMLLSFFEFELKMAVCTRLMQEGKHLNNIWSFFKKSQFHFDVFSKVTFSFKFWNSISRWSRRLEHQKKSFVKGILTLAN